MVSVMCQHDALLSNEEKDFISLRGDGSGVEPRLQLVCWLGGLDVLAWECHGTKLAKPRTRLEHVAESRMRSPRNANNTTIARSCVSRQTHGPSSFSVTLAMRDISYGHFSRRIPWIERNRDDV